MSSFYFPPQGSGGGGGGVTSLNTLTGAITLAAGTNITLVPVGNTITINASGGGGSSPLTTKGDLYTYSTLDTRLPVGTNGQVLSANSATATGLEWITSSITFPLVVPNSATPNILSDSDTGFAFPSDGLINIYNNNVLTLALTPSTAVFSVPVTAPDFVYPAQANNTFLSGPVSGGPSVPNFRTIALGDIPNSAIPWPLQAPTGPGLQIYSDSDTGFNFPSDGVIDIYADNTVIVEITPIGVDITGDLDVSGNISAANYPPVGTANTIAGFDGSGNIYSITGWNVNSAFGLNSNLTYAPVGTNFAFQNYDSEISAASDQPTSSTTGFYLNSHVDRSGSGFQVGDYVNMYNILTLEGTGDVANVTSSSIYFRAGINSNTGIVNSFNGLNLDLGVGDNYTVTQNFNSINISGQFSATSTVTQSINSLYINTNPSGTANEYIGIFNGTNITGQIPFITGLRQAFNIDNATVTNYRTIDNTPQFGNASAMSINSFIGVNNAATFQANSTLTNGIGINESTLFNNGSALTNNWDAIAISNAFDGTSSNFVRGLALAQNVGTNGHATSVTSHYDISVNTNIGADATVGEKRVLDVGAGAQLGSAVTNWTDVSIHSNIQSNLSGDYLGMQLSSNVAGGVNYKGVQLTPGTGTFSGQISGMAIDLSQLISSSGQAKIGLSIGDGSLAVNSNIDTSLVTLSPGEFHANYLGGTLTIASGSPISGTFIFGNNMGLTIVANDDMAADGFLGSSSLGLSVNGLVNQFSVAAGKTVDTVQYMMAGGGVSSGSGTVNNLAMFRAIGLLPSGGTLSIGNYYGFEVDGVFDAMAASATNAWAFYDGSTQENFLNKLAIGTSTKKVSSGVTLDVAGVIQSSTSLRLLENGGGTDYVEFKAPAALSASYTLFWPTDDGTPGQFLQTDGIGNLSWQTSSGSGANINLSNLGTTSINSDLTFAYTAAVDHFVNVEPGTGGNAGDNLAIVAGASSPGTNVLGGGLYLSSGDSTGTGDSQIFFQIPLAGASGTSTNPAQVGMSLEGSNQLGLWGTISGTFRQSAAPTTTSYDVIWPDVQATGTQLLQNDGAGNLSWASAPAATIMIGSNVGSGSAHNVLFLDASSNLTQSALTNGQFLIGATGAAPVAGTITGTANQVIVSTGTNSITLSTPQSIGTGSSPTFTGLTLSSFGTAGVVHNNSSGVLSSSLIVNADITNATIDLTTKVTGLLPGTNGGTGVSNAGTFTYGASNLSFTLSGATSITLPTSGTMATLAGTENFSNKTFTNGTLFKTTIALEDPGAGTNTVTLQAPTLSAGYTLTLPVDDGTLNQVLTTDGSGVLSWTTPAAAGANTALSNLASVAVNTVIKPATDLSTDIGTNLLRFDSGYYRMLKDSSGVNSVEPTARNLYDSSGTVSLNWNTTDVRVGVPLRLPEVSTPATPSSGFGLIYFKTDNNLYAKNDAGTELQITPALINPMTTAGDIIYGAASGVATRFAAGSAGQILTTTGSAPAYITSVPIANGGTGATTKAGGFDALSPLTTAGDILYGGTAGTGTRFAAGTAGQILTTTGTVPAYITLVPIANGGTNSSATATAGGVGYGTGTAHAYTSAGTADNWVLSGGAGAPTMSNTATTGKFIDGSADEVQLQLQGNSTQTNDILLVEKSDGTDLLNVTNVNGTKIRGTTTNDAAAAGFVGQYIESVITSATNFPTTTQFGDLTSISLTAGDWDVTAGLYATANGATVTTVTSGITSTTGNSATGIVDGSNSIAIPAPNATTAGSGFISSFRVSLSVTTTYYLKYKASFSVATPQAVGRLSARRIR